MAFSNFCLGWPNRIDAGLLTASSAEQGMPVTNIATEAGGADQAWQSVGITGSITLTLPAADSFRAFGLFRTNLTDSATIRWRVFPTSSTGGSATYDSGTVLAGVMRGYAQTVLVLPNAVPGQAIQVDIADTSNPDGFLNVPLAYAGPVWQAARNFDASSSTGRTMQSNKTITRGGGVINRLDWIKRTFTLSLSGIRAAEVWPKVMDVDLYARRGNNVLFVPDPLDPLINSTAIYGELEASSEVTYPNRVIEARGWKAIITERL